jgi:hypothetical protein
MRCSSIIRGRSCHTGWVAVSVVTRFVVTVLAGLIIAATLGRGNRAARRASIVALIVEQVAGRSALNAFLVSSVGRLCHPWA